MNAVTLMKGPELRKRPKPIVSSIHITHGTLEVSSIKESRKFFEEFLGLETVQHAGPGLVVRLTPHFHIICIEVGDNVKPLHFSNHWGVNVATVEEVDEAYRKLVELKDVYKIGAIDPPKWNHGAYSVYFEDLNHSWWEIEYYDGSMNLDTFELGDQVPS